MIDASVREKNNSARMPQSIVNSPKQTLEESQIEALVHGRHGNPFAVLGIHALSRNTWLLRCLLPGANRVRALGRHSQQLLGELEQIHDGGLFEGRVTFPSRFGTSRPEYQLEVDYPLTTELREDPYRFDPLLSGDDLHLFHEGRHENTQDFLGAHPETVEGVQGVLFAVWAPNASRVAVVGDFNHWDSRIHGMRCHYNSGIWELLSLIHI